ncbi:MAG: serine/threonine protein kinase [Acidobacteriota bacterium]|nr:serine/threonine protein kinase [Acidobacteriota bacterium]
MSDWARVAQLFERALDLPSGGRDAFFRAEAGSDAALLDELRSLLRGHERAEAASFIDEPLAAAQPDLILNTLQSGQRISAYEIIEEAGRGGMGVVYRARDTRLGRDVAVKSVAEGASAVQKARLEHEARLAARISHPAIATVFALEEHDGQMFLVSEFVAGETLRDRLARGPLSPADLARFARDIAGGLAAAHREGVAHGDLKPENVIVRTDGQIKVLDFGLAEMRKESTPVAASRMFAGTPGYMAPEQLRGDVPDPRADVFAFGVLLFEMATGRHPFAGDRGAMLEAALSARAAFDAPDVPSAFAAVIRRCLSPDASDRFPSAAEVGAALEGAAPAARPAPAGRSVRWFVVHQRIVAGMVAAMPAVAWIARPEITGQLGPPWGSIAFLGTLAGAAVVVAIRLNSAFVARERPAELARHLESIQTRLWRSEIAFDLCLLAAGLMLADKLDWAAGLLFGCGIVSGISLSVIEPATTRAAVRATSTAMPPA